MQGVPPVPSLRTHEAYGQERARWQAVRRPRPARARRAGAPGTPQMTDEELMQSTIQSAAGRVAKGKVRRKRVGGRRGLAELSKLHA